MFSVNSKVVSNSGNSYLDSVENPITNASSHGIGAAMGYGKRNNYSTIVPKNTGINTKGRVLGKTSISDAMFDLNDLIIH